MNHPSTRLALPLLAMLIIMLLAVPSNALASDGEWTWMSGANTHSQAGVYGTQGVPSPTNVPGMRHSSISWIDATGNLWLFGGAGVNKRNDLWRYDVNGEWAWMSGANTVDQQGTYGTKGVPAADNVPGARSNSISWIDGDGNLWLFGGSGRDGVPTWGDLNDLWRYDVNTGQWTWMSGASTRNQVGVYGVKGEPAPANMPGGRYSSISWMDADGDLWLFGGYGRASASSEGRLNDLWRYNVSADRWTWMSGADTINQRGTYGDKGEPAPTNVPGARDFSISWIDGDDNLWLFGGYGVDSGGGWGRLNDLWRYDVSTGQWTWISGASTHSQAGVYGIMGTPHAANVPGARSSGISWIDAAANLWLFGGYGLDESAVLGRLNDLWHYNVITGQWTWVSGANTVNQIGVYGIKGTSDPANVPGARAGSISWIDAAGELWLFSGYGRASVGEGSLNDLWRYSPQAPTSSIIFVDHNAAGANDGTSWTNAYTTLQAALAQTNANGSTSFEIWVARGTYHPGAARSDSFRIQRNNVQLYGGFAGNETERDQRNWKANPTVLSCDIGAPGDYADNCYHVLYVDGTTHENIDSATVIDGFIVTGGNANNVYNWPHGNGGGLVCIANGGGKKCSPRLASIHFSENRAYNGGAMSPIAAFGGVSSPNLTNVTFTENRASEAGGGMYNDGYVGESSPILTNVTFSGNQADGFGGGMYNNGYSTNGVSSPTLTRVTFSGNTAVSSAGGMYNSGAAGGQSSPQLMNVIFSGNTGGGMFNRGVNGVSSPVLMNVTISGNKAGGMRSNASGSGVSAPVMVNCILWGNAAPQIYNENNAMPTISYSLIGGSGGSGAWNTDLGVDGGHNLDVNPVFVAPVAAGSAPTSAGNYRLGFGSPAIDTGTNTGCPVNDRDGNPRPNDGDGDEVVVCDMGAYEAGTMVPTIGIGPIPIDGHPGVGIDITVLGDLAFIYVDEMGVDHPDATSEMTSGQYWHILGLQGDGTTSASDFEVTLTLPHDLPDHSEVQACRFGDDSTWDCDRSGSDASTVTRSGITGFSDWVVSNGVPLAVTLAAFDAVQQDDYVLVSWETVSEVGNAGFNLYRSDSAAGPLTLLTWLPSQAPGSTVGYAYSYEDRTVLSGQTLYYFLEDISLSGATTLHGPVSVTIHPPTAVTLAGMVTGSQVGIGWGWLLALVAVGLALAGALAGRRQGQIRVH